MVVVASLLGAGAAVVTASPAAASTTVVTVKPGNLAPRANQYWAQEPSTTGHHSFVSGPATPPGGGGSLAMSMTAGQKVGLFNYSYGKCYQSPTCTNTAAMTSLANVDALSFSTYRASGTSFPTYNVEIYATGTATYSTLVFVPNGVVDSTWQTFDAMSPADGTWYSTTNLSALGSGLVFDCAFLAAGCDASWSEIVTDYPNAKIVYGLGPNIGTGGTFSGNVDNLTIGVSGSTSVYDFEPNSESTTVVRSDDEYPTAGLTATWATAPSTTGSHSYVSGPGTPPGGVGSLAMSMTSGQKVGVFNYAYGKCAGNLTCSPPAAMTPLVDVDALRFSAYRASGTSYPTFNIEIYKTDPAGPYSSFVFIPNAGAIVDATWQTWDAMSTADGTWYSTTNLGSGHFNCTFQSAGCNASWSQILADYPNAKIVYGLGPNIGTGGTFTGNVDNLTIGINGADTVYDFEPYTEPGAPTIGSVVRGNAEVAVSWTAPTYVGGRAITGYVVTPYDGATALPDQTFGSPATTQTVTGLTNGTSYTFKVAAINVVGTGSQSAASALATPATTPGAPTISSVVRGDSEVTVSWTAPGSDGGEAITGYEVIPYDGPTALTPQTFDASATTRAITGLTNGTSYTFKVAATNAVGTGSQSTASRPVIPVSTSPVVVHPIDVYPLGPGPWAPEPSTTGSYAFVTGAGTPPGGVGSLQMSMTAGQKVNLNHYGYGRCALGPACNSAASMTPLADIDALDYSTYRASGGQIPTMNIEIWADGVGQYTSLVFVPDIGSVVDATWQSWDAMNPADGTWYSTANLGSLGAGLAFDCNFQAAGCEASWEEIVADYPSAKIVYGIGPNIGTGGTFSGNVDDFTIGLSGVASVYDFEPAAVPGAPTIGSVVRGNGQVTVSWTAPASNGFSPITGYVVTPYDGATALADQTFSSTATTQTATGLTNGTSYTFKVAAVNAVGTGGQSAASGPAMPATTPGAPTIGSVVRGNTKVTVSWTVPGSDGGEAITGYVVTPYRGAVAQTPQVFDASSTTRDIIGLINGAPYRFKVAATNVVGTGGQSAFSASATPATVPLAPTIGSASPRNGGAVVSWTWPIGTPYNGGSAITGFTVTPYIGAVAQPSQTFMSTAVSQTVTGLTNGTTYTFTVVAMNAVGTGPSSAATAPVTPVVTLAVVGGGTHSCALLPTRFVQCWGSNSAGQIGDGTTTRRVVPILVTGLSGASALAAGTAHTCALLTDGTVKCWGSNSLGQLGDGTLQFRLVPTPVSGLSGVTAIAASGNHTCALINDGTVRCWGDNAQGAAGDGTVGAAKKLPVTVLGLSGVTAITAGAGHVCALLGSGALSCWGANAWGQLGDGTQVNRATPVSVLGVTGATAVAGLGASTCAITAGLVQCWGLNSLGQLGDGTVVTRSTAAPVGGLTGVTALSGGLNHACARLTAGTVKCWGASGSGQVGDGSTTSYRTTPRAVTGLGGVASLGTGSNHSLARLTSGRLRAWGANGWAQIGDGTLVNRPTFVAVSGLG